MRYLLLALLLLLSGCNSSSTTTTTDSFTQEEKGFLQRLFTTEYLWADQVTPLRDTTPYTTPKAMIEALRVSPPDHWSFMVTKAAYEAFANQKTEGFGIGMTQEFILYLVRIDAPAYGKLLRGDKLLEINHQPITAERLTQASQALGEETTFRLLRAGKELEVSVTPQAYSFKVSEGKVLTVGTKKVGYLRFDSFTGSAVAEFESIFTQFHDAGVDELIIDLRYNGGGSVTTASLLLDNITRDYPQKEQFYMDWNSHYQYNNSRYYFAEQSEQDGNELAMDRVFFLVTEQSASASELVISSLIPYLGDSHVITIGSDTHGKPVGMSGAVYQDHYYFLINFFVQNSAGNHSSFDGIAVTCEAQDDLTHLRGDANETMLKTALSYIETGGC